MRQNLLAQTLARVLTCRFVLWMPLPSPKPVTWVRMSKISWLRLIQSADYDIQRAQQGIIYIDEIDKVARNRAR
ncbi:MAG: AAA family ATPase [Anaerolineae bacterium]